VRILESAAFLYFVPAHALSNERKLSTQTNHAVADGSNSAPSGREGEYFGFEHSDCNVAVLAVALAAHRAFPYFSLSVRSAADH